MIAKGLTEETSDRIGRYVQLNGGPELVVRLLADEYLIKAKPAVSGLNNMQLLLKYCDIMGLSDHVRFDLSLARGLDYYTGVIYECVLKSEPPAAPLLNGGGEESGPVGSVAGGGRYDNLVGMFDAKGRQVPCVGVSIGVERIFAVLEAKHASTGMKQRTNDVEVYVASAHKNLHEKRLSIVTSLWDAGIKASIPFYLSVWK